MFRDWSDWGRRGDYARTVLLWRLLGVDIDLSRRWPTVDGRARLRNAKKIQLHARSSVLAYAYLKSAGGDIVVGEYSAIGEFCYINAVQSVRIGNGVLLAPRVHITDAHHMTRRSQPIRGQGRRVEPVSVQDDCWIGVGVTVLAGVTIGQGSVIGAGSVVTKSTQPSSINAGVPCRQIGERLQ